jgi:hypothetical protein
MLRRHLTARAQNMPHDDNDAFLPSHMPEHRINESVLFELTTVKKEKLIRLQCSTCQDKKQGDTG